MTERYQSTYVGDKFQLTRSRGAWRTIEYTLEKAASFQLTRSRGAWPWYADRFCAPSYFNSHAHVERDIFRTANECIWHYFNSHAHVERDAVFDNLIVKSDISTHTLTWSVTSTHWVLITQCENFNSHAHVERDLYSCNVATIFFHFNSHAHVERDVKQICVLANWKNFNSHAHVERDRS